MERTYPGNRIIHIFRGRREPVHTSADADATNLQQIPEALSAATKFYIGDPWAYFNSKTGVESNLHLMELYRAITKGKTLTSHSLYHALNNANQMDKAHPRFLENYQACHQILDGPDRKIPEALSDQYDFLQATYPEMRINSARPDQPRDINENTQKAVGAYLNLQAGVLIELHHLMHVTSAEQSHQLEETRRISLEALAQIGEEIGVGSYQDCRDSLEIAYDHLGKITNSLHKTAAQALDRR